MTKDTPAADPRRSLELLWGAGSPQKRGPKPRLSTEEVVRAAVEIADAEGMEAISMRRVAEAVGVSPMSLYTYVPSKSELVDLMLDCVAGEMTDPDETVQGWRAKLTYIACQRWGMVQRHPWLLDLEPQRPALGPNIVARMESVLGALDGMGLEDRDMELVSALLHNYVAGALRSARVAQELARRSGLTDAEWVSQAAPALWAYVDPERYPRLARLTEAWRSAGKTPADPREAFEFGLQRVLDGIEVFLGTRGRTA